MLTTIVKDWIKTVGIYQHLKTEGFYLVIGWGWESTNNRPREKIVAYFSFKKRTLNFRRWDEFFESNIWENITDEKRIRKLYEKQARKAGFYGVAGYPNVLQVILPHRFKKVLGFGAQPVVIDSFYVSRYEEMKFNLPPRCTSCELVLTLPPTRDCKTPTAHSWKKEV